MAAEGIEGFYTVSFPMNRLVAGDEIIGGGEGSNKGKRLIVREICVSPSGIIFVQFWATDIWRTFDPGSRCDFVKAANSGK